MHNDFFKIMKKIKNRSIYHFPGADLLKYLYLFYRLCIFAVYGTVDNTDNNDNN